MQIGDPSIRVHHGEAWALGVAPLDFGFDLVAPGPIDLVLNDSYGGYDSITIENLALTGNAGSLIQISAGPPAEYFYLVNPLDMELTLSADGPAPRQALRQLTW